MSGASDRPLLSGTQHSWPFPACQTKSGRPGFSFFYAWLQPPHSPNLWDSGQRCGVNKVWLYLAVVVGLLARKVIGWPTPSRVTKGIGLNVRLMAVWRRNPQKQVRVHPQQSTQYTGAAVPDITRTKGRISRRGNCHDNAVAESVFQWLKRERIKKKIGATREKARGDIFDRIELFYHCRRRHGSRHQRPPAECENQHYQRPRKWLDYPWRFI